MNNEAILVADLRSTAKRVCDMIDVRHGSQLMLQAADVIEQRGTTALMDCARMEYLDAAIEYLDAATDAAMKDQLK